MMAQGWCLPITIVLFFAILEPVKRQPTSMTLQSSSPTPISISNSAHKYNIAVDGFLPRKDPHLHPSPTLRSSPTSMQIPHVAQHQTGFAIPDVLMCALPAMVGILWFHKKTSSRFQVALLPFTSVHASRGPRPLCASLQAPGDDSSEETEADEEDMLRPPVPPGCEEWDPPVPEGFQVVDVADDEVLTLEQLDAVAASLREGGSWPDETPRSLEESQGDAEAVEGEPLPFSKAPPSRYTKEGFAIVSDVADNGMEVMYTMEPSEDADVEWLSLDAQGGAEPDNETREENTNDGWEQSGWTTGKQRRIKRSIREWAQERLSFKRPDLRALVARPPKQKRSKLPIIAVVGRPNVGKSTLVNRICNVAPNEGAITNDAIGVTRDRTYRYAQFEGFSCMVVDTGGLIFEDREEYIFAKEIRQQALIALNECKVAIVVVDGQDGPSPLDADVARLIQHDFLKKGIAVYLAVNKCEGDSVDVDLNIAAFWSLGLGEPRPVSSIHGTGVYELLHDICHENFTPMDAAPDDSKISVALVGRPNVGKSSLLNRLLGEERVIVSPIAGTTRDTIDCELERGPHTFRFVDTAGLRHAAKVEDGNEFLMANRTVKAIARADVCLLLLDATTPGFVTMQDKSIAERIAEAGVACCILLNKWDVYEGKDNKSYLEADEEIQGHLPNMCWAPRLTISAATGLRCKKLFDMILEADAARRLVIGVLDLNDALFAAMRMRAPVSTSNSKGGRVYYAVQESTKPPRVVVYVNRRDPFSENYRRYLEKELRQSFPLAGSPLELLLESIRQREAVKRCPPEITTVIWTAVDEGKPHPYTALCT